MLKILKSQLLGHTRLFSQRFSSRVSFISKSQINQLIIMFHLVLCLDLIALYFTVFRMIILPFFYLVKRRFCTKENRKS